jgi:hypothetical protein
MPQFVSTLFLRGCWGSEIDSNKLFIFFGIDFMRRLRDQYVSSKSGFANMFPQVFVCPLSFERIGTSHFALTHGVLTLRASPRVCQILLGKSYVLPTSKKVCQVKKEFISNSLA